MCVYTYIHYFFEGIRVSKAMRTKGPKSQNEGKLRESTPTSGTAFSLKSFFSSQVAAETSGN